MHNVDDLIFLRKTGIHINVSINQNLSAMQEFNCNDNKKSNTKNDEIISFKCELHGNLQKAMNKFVEKHPNWDQYRILQAAIAGFLMQKGFQNRDLTRLYIGKMFSMDFEN